MVSSAPEVFCGERLRENTLLKPRVRPHPTQCVPGLSVAAKLSKAHGVAREGWALQPPAKSVPRGDI